jgi:ATP phosphoribosyltransferase regulatory subunit HisZ
LWGNKPNCIGAKPGKSAISTQSRTNGTLLINFDLTDVRFLAAHHHLVFALIALRVHTPLQAAGRFINVRHLLAFRV